MHRISFTFDIDCTDYSTGRFIDEPSLYVSGILSSLNDIGLSSTTWFVRIDQGELLRNETLSNLIRYAKDLISQIRDAGHEVGWHHHSSISNAQTESELVNEVRKFASVARELGLEKVRSGFAQMTSSVLCELLAAGFTLDSSCISRPNYSWAPVPLRDWTQAPNVPYYPCIDDYQRECNCQRDLIEVPITTVPLSLETDTQPGVLRYLNPAYSIEMFRRGFDRWRDTVESVACLTTITHPYEAQAGVNGSESGFLDNIRYVLDADVQHSPLGEIS